MGAPLFANYQAALAYPPTWSQLIISFVAGIEVSAWWQGVLVVLHWIVAALGMRQLARGLGLGGLAQAVSGLAFALGGYLVSRAGFLSINAAAAWLPWIVYYAGQVSSARLRGEATLGHVVVKLSVVAGLQLLAGHAQTAWYTVLLAGTWSAYWCWIDAGDKPSNALSFACVRIVALLKGWLRLASGYAIGVGLAAIQLLPTAEYLAGSQRAGEVDFQFAMTYSYWPWRFLTLLAPDLFGSPVRGDYWGYSNYWEDALYIGLLPLLLALGVLFGWMFRRVAFKKSQINNGEGILQAPRFEAIPFLAVLMVFSFVLALGDNTVIFPWLYRHVPTFDMFQAPTRFTIWAAFALALLAGYGAQVWRRPQKRALYWTRLATAGAVAVMIGAGLTWFLMGDVSPTFIRAAALAGFWGVGAGVLSLTAPVPGVAVDAHPKTREAARSYKDIWWWFVAVFIALDLIAAGWGLNPGVDTQFYSTEAQSALQVQEMLLGRRLYLSTADEDILKYKRFLRFDGFDSGEDWLMMRAVLLPNMTMFDSIASLNNFDPLTPDRYTRWMDILSHAEGDERAMLLDISAAGVVETRDTQTNSGVRFQQLPVEIGARARWVRCARAARDPEEALQLVMTAAFDPDQAVVIEGLKSQQITGCADGGVRGVVDLVDEAPGGLEYRVHADQPGWLLLSDTWYPGWRAFVDGDEVPVLRADYLFRAVQIPAGDHRVRFSYRPPPFYIGLAMTAITLLAVITFIIRGRAPQ